MLLDKPKLKLIKEQVLTQFSEDLSSFEQYQHIRSFIFSLMQLDATGKEEAIDNLVGLCRKIRDIQLFDSHYLDNFLLSVLMVFNSKTPLSETNRDAVIEIIDERTRPDIRVAGLEPAIKLFSGWLTYEFVQRDSSANGAIKFLADLFSLPERVVRSCYAKFQEKKDEIVEHKRFLLVLLFYCTQYKNISLDSVQKSLSGHVSTQKSYEKTLKSYQLWRTEVIIEAVESVKEFIVDDILFKRFSLESLQEKLCNLSSDPSKALELSDDDVFLLFLASFINDLAEGNFLKQIIHSIKGVKV